MTTDQGMLFALIGALFILLIWGRYRHDLVAFGALLLAYLMGSVPSDQVFAGFGHPAMPLDPKCQLPNKTMKLRPTRGGCFRCWGGP